MLKKIYFLTIFSLITFPSFLTAEIMRIDMDPYEYTEVVQNVGRLNNLLNSRDTDQYAIVKGYSHEDAIPFENILFADCSIDKQQNRLQIILYFRSIIPRPNEGEKISENRQMFALRVFRMIMNFCREFIYKGINPNEVKLIAKYRNPPDIESDNTLFVWEDGEVTFFPLLFNAEISTLPSKNPV